jgi:hypothetical protein
MICYNIKVKYFYQGERAKWTVRKANRLTYEKDMVHKNVLKFMFAKQ